MSSTAPARLDSSRPDTSGAMQSDFAIFADFDGTLVALAARPEDVVMPAGLPGALAGLEQRVDNAFAIVTGRPIVAVDGFLGRHFAIAGAHGTERRRADGTLVGPGPDMVEASDRIFAMVEPLVVAEPRLVLERKLGAVALHYRQAPELEVRCRAAMTEALALVDGFALVAGKMVFEARPSGVDKGVAISTFMIEPPFAGRLPVFFGDDTTDEDGFAAVQRLGGLGVKVGEGPTTAQLRVPDLHAVRRFLDAFGDTGALKSIADVRAFADDLETATP